ncbi:MAG: secretin and TonB N-terminal domain-containing protein [candidate division Zixibacteria bacterium]
MKSQIRIICFWFALFLVFTQSGWPNNFNPNARVSLNFDETPINTVLKMLAVQNDLNLVVSSDIKENISIHINNVGLNTALDAILLPNGLNYYFSEDVIIVKKADKQVAGEHIAKTYKLKFISAEAAAAAIEPLKSGQGKIIPIAPPPKEDAPEAKIEAYELVVFDTPENHQIIGVLLDQIDIRRRQITIEAKIIETNLTDDEKLGINWPKSISASINGVAAPGQQSSSLSDNTTEAAMMPLETGNWQLGHLSVHQMDIVIDFLRQRNNSKLLSNPRVTTLDNEPAKINIETVIPIQTINRFSEGAVIQDIVTFQDEKIGISLEVTPRINNDSTITMRVHPIVEEIIGYTGPAENQKPITSRRSITTTVTVKNNETIALGGLLKESQIENQSKIFLLSEIPFLGSLFTHNTKEIKTTDLLILLTPRIID